jgi:hypothetical protein
MKFAATSFLAPPRQARAVVDPCWVAPAWQLSKSNSGAPALVKWNCGQLSLIPPSRTRTRFNAMTIMANVPSANTNCSTAAKCDKRPPR